MGRDAGRSVPPRCTRHFNPRAPCGARLMVAVTRPKQRNFNPRAPCGARHRRGKGRACRPYFNPRAPCGARQQTRQRPRLQALFQSTRPVWGATHGVLDRADLVSISIHAPRVGRDSMRLRISSFSLNFNPRAPCGARPEYADH